MAAGLLHDVGHGPLSHALEVITDHNIDHEKYSELIITSDTEVNKVLNKFGINPNNVASLIEGSHPKKSLVSLISSNIDADRMDYLQRDAYYTGTMYGMFDMERIIKSMIITEDGVIFRESGLAAIEHFLIARYQAFNQVYHHRVSVAYEELYKLIFNRIIDIDSDNEITSEVKRLIQGQITLDEYIDLDDNKFFSYIQDLCKSEDEVLKELAIRIRDRKLFRAATYTPELYNAVQDAIVADGKNPKYFLSKTELKASAYKAADKAYKNVSVRLRDSREVKSLDEVSTIIGPMVDNFSLKELVIYPKEYEPQA
jgi:HD superfamily phosphohydrolase